MTKQDKKLYNYCLNKSEEKQKEFIISNKSLDKMNRELIRRWNERVKSEDIVFCIGDFCFKNCSSKRGEGIKISASYWEKQLNGKIIHIRGNHDKNNSTKTIIEKLVIKFDNKYINLVHNPAHFDPTYKIHFCGHIHNNWKFQRKILAISQVDLINVGVDVWNFYPVLYKEIWSKYCKWKKQENKRYLGEDDVNIRNNSSKI